MRSMYDTPVSYTHLDVYKRQVLTSYSRGEGTNLHGSAFRVLKTIRSGYHGNRIECILVAIASVEAVSYTHLDVYKRQVYMCPNGKSSKIVF